MKLFACEQPNGGSQQQLRDAHGCQRRRRPPCFLLLGCFCSPAIFGLPNVHFCVRKTLAFSFPHAVISFSDLFFSCSHSMTVTH